MLSSFDTLSVITAIITGGGGEERERHLKSTKLKSENKHSVIRSGASSLFKIFFTEPENLFRLVHNPIGGSKHLGDSCCSAGRLAQEHVPNEF